MVHLSAIWIGYLLVLQASVDATIDIYNYAYQMIYSFSNRDATIIDGYIEGYIELSSPPDACTEIAKPAFVPKGIMKNMVLINGTSECDFMSKIENAKAVGYEVAVLFDPFPEPFNYTNMVFPIPSSKINMSVVLVSCKDGINILTNYLYPQSSEWNNVIIIISPTIWRTVTLYSVAVLILIVFAICVGILPYKIAKKIVEKCILNQHEEEETDDHNETSDGEISEDFEREEMAERILRNLNTRFPSKVFSEEDPFETCVICCNDFQVGEMFRKLKCPHAYHTDCIDDWLKRSKKRLCPLCKNNVSLENSIELPPSNTSDTTPLLASTNNPSPTMQNSRPSNLSRFAVRPRSFGEIRSSLVEVLGSVNSVLENASGGEEDANAFSV